MAAVLGFAVAEPPLRAAQAGMMVKLATVAARRLDSRFRGQGGRFGVAAAGIGDDAAGWECLR